MGLRNGSGFDQLNTNNSASLPTFLLLATLGFEPDASVVSDPPGGMSFDFGDLKLKAAHCIDREFQPVVLFSGVLTRARTTTMVSFRLPRRLDSQEMGKAWLVWCLDNELREVYRPVTPTPWLDEGRCSFHLLPWVQSMEAYEARPKCMVERKWARLALNDLEKQLVGITDDAIVRFGFDGSVLIIQCGEKTIALPAEGEPWPSQLAIGVEKLRRLPKRLMRDRIEISVWDETLRIDRRLYRDAKALQSAS